MKGIFLPALAGLIGLFLPVYQAQAIEFYVGGGLAYTHMVVASDIAGGTNSVYEGPGYLGEARLRTSWLKSFFVIDFFGNYSYMKTSNTNAVANESTNRSAYGGGLDLHLHHLFVGAQYQVASTAITAAGFTTTLAYNSPGVRAGYDFVLGGRVTLSLGAVAETGRASLQIRSVNVTNTVHEYTGFAVLQFKLYRTYVPSM